MQTKHEHREYEKTKAEGESEMKSRAETAVKIKIKDTIEEHELFENGMHIVLGLSGGPDSVCLFDVLCELAKEQNLKIYPVHINHKFRPGAAEADQEYVEGLCRLNGLQCESFVYDCGKIAETEGLTSEEAGRKVRYEAFVQTAENVARRNAVSKDKIVIAVAQNANDQAETILFRMLRGSGTDGLAGIAYKRYEKGFAVVRPLLDVSRDEIERYCKERNLSPRRDHTNEEAVYTRNKIRLELIPMLAERFNPNIIDTVNRLGRSAACDKDFLYEEAYRAYESVRCPAERSESDNRMKEKESQNTVQNEKQVSMRGLKSSQRWGKECSLEVYALPLSKLHKAVRIRIYHIMLEEIGMTENITQGQLDAIERVCFSESPSAACDLSDGFRASKMYDRLRFYRVQSESKYEYRMSIMNMEEYEKLSRCSHSEDIRCVGVFAMKHSEAEQVSVRKRRDGDSIAIRVKNAEGEYEIKNKKLQDFFVDVKLPKLYRDEVFLLAYGSRILWILPSEYFNDSRLREKGRFSAEYSMASLEKRCDSTAPCEDKTILVLEVL